MTERCNIALKNGRIKSKKKIMVAAQEIGMEERTLRRYENGEVKDIKDDVIAMAIDVYNDIEIGVTYLNNNAVSLKLFGKIELADAIHATMEYIGEHEDDNHIKRELQEWSLKDGREPLSETLERELNETLRALIKVILANLEAKKRPLIYG